MNLEELYEKISETGDLMPLEARGSHLLENYCKDHKSKYYVGKKINYAHACFYDFDLRSHLYSKIFPDALSILIQLSELTSDAEERVNQEIYSVYSTDDVYLKNEAEAALARYIYEIKGGLFLKDKNDLPFDY